MEFIWIQMIINWFPLLHEVTYMIENSFWLNYFIIKSSSWFISLIKETLYSVHDFCFLILKMCPENFRKHLRYKNVYFFIIVQVFFKWDLRSSSETSKIEKCCTSFPARKLRGYYRQFWGSRNQVLHERKPHLTFTCYLYYTN